MFNFRSKKYKQDIEPQEVFLDELARKKEKELGFSERKFEVPLSQKILKGVFFSIFLIIFILFVITFNFQIIKGKKYIALSNDNKFITYSIRADRGVIYDINGIQLAYNKPSFNLMVNEDELPEDETERQKIFEEIKKITNGKYENIDHQTLILLETRINEFPGFYVDYSSVRYYDDSLNFSHIIGYSGRDGVEKTYDDILKKNSGEIKIERDVYGEILSKELISYPEPGKSLVLWVDSDLQRKVNQALHDILEKTGSKKAVGIALNPKTGGVMALVSIPEYDNNLFNEGADQEQLKNLLNDPQQPLFNRAISGLYPTGSTIKPIIAAAALQEEIISYKKDIMCSGQIAIPHRYDPEITYYHKDWAVHGATDLRKALAESCNVYFYTIGGGYGEQEGLGPSRIKKYVELFGWGDKTGIDLPGEANGFIPSPEWKQEAKGEPWFDGDTYNLSIGQGDVSVTPLQVALAFSAIANGGTLYSPKVVKEIVDENKNIIQKIKPEILRSNFINSDNLDIVRQGMRWAVSGENSPQASSILLNSLPVKVAAKTGTAQTAVKDLYHNWIGVFAPYEDPEIVLIIMIENVKDLQAAALPTAKQILQYYFTP